MLNGIGGRTIEEAKERMSYAEAMQWSEYMRQRGTLHSGVRLELGFATLALLINRALGGKAELTDYMPWTRAVELPDATLDDVMAILSGVKR